MSSLRGRSATVVALVVVGFLVLIWGAGADTSVVRRPSSTLDLSPPQGSAPSPSLTPTPRPTQSQGSQDRTIDVDWILLIGICVLLVVIGMLVRWLLTREDDSILRIEAQDALDTLVEATATDPARLRTEGDPRNAVVACWVALEDGVARAGLERSPAETSLDLATRVLARWQVDPEATATLAGLYREARFSRHPVTEQERDRAVSALQRINTGLRAARERARDAPGEAVTPTGPSSDADPEQRS